MTRITLLALAFTGMAACDTPSEPTQQTAPVDVPSLAMISSRKYDFSGITFNPCPPTELVAYEGSLYEHHTGEITNSGYDLKVHLNSQRFEGIGLTSGDRYHLIQNIKVDLELSNLPPTFERQFQDERLRLIRRGRNDNLYARQTFKLSSPPFQFEIIRLEIECRG